MNFVNRKNERELFKKYLELGEKVFVIHSSKGRGKSAFIKFMLSSNKINFIEVDIQSSYNTTKTLKKLATILDQHSEYYGYISLKKFIQNKNIMSNIVDKVIGIITNDLKTILSNSNSDNYDIYNISQENTYNYLKKVLNSNEICIFIENANFMDEESLLILNNIIKENPKSIFIFESNEKEHDTDNYIDLHSFFNNYRVNYCSIKLEKLNNIDVIEILQNMGDINFENNKEEYLKIECLYTGNLKDFVFHVKNYIPSENSNTLNIEYSLYEKIHSYLDYQQDILYTILNWKTRISHNDLIDFIKNGLKIIDIPKSEIEKSILDFQKNNFLVITNNEITLSDLVKNVLVKDIKNRAIKSSLLKFLTEKVREKNEISTSDYIKYSDVLLNIYLEISVLNLPNLIDYIEVKLKDTLNTNDSEKFFNKIVNALILEPDANGIIDSFIVIAYNYALYEQARALLKAEYRNFSIDKKYILYEAIFLNRLELFSESNEWIDKHIRKFDKKSEPYLIINLIKMMNLKQLDLVQGIDKIQKKIQKNTSLYEHYNIYPYYLRFCSTLSSSNEEKVSLLKQAIDLQKNQNDNVNLSKTYINLCVQYILQKDYNNATTYLQLASQHLGSDKNQTILHCYATIELHKNNIIEKIEENLQDALVTAVNNYDKLAIYNNLLVYYIKTENVKKGILVADNLEILLEKTHYERFNFKIIYNLYLFFNMAYNETKKQKFKKCLIDKKKEYLISKKQEPYLMYLTFWQFPLLEIR